MPIREVIGESSTNSTCKTFILEGENHTLGGILQDIICRYDDVEFCGYTIPHPSEKNINLRIQSKGTLPIDILTRAFQDVEKICDHISQQFNAEVEIFKN